MSFIKRIFPECVLHEVTAISDSRGSLVALESNRNVPFPIRRVYFLFGSEQDSERGFHAHLALKQWIVCVHGSCILTVDDGLRRRNVQLASPTSALYIGPSIWREIKDFNDDAVLLILASEYYDEADYIRDYQEFCKVTSRKGVI